MISENLKSVPAGTAGVYCMFDLDGKPAYAGQTCNLRNRLRQHFIRQDSSVVSYGRLDIWDIAYVDWWETTDTDRAERKVLSTHTPYLNFDAEIAAPQGSVALDLDRPDGTLELVSDEERAFRADPYNRSKQKLEHLLRMVDTIKLAGHSEATKKTLYVHQRIFHENVSEFLEVDPEEASSTLSDWTE